MENSTIRCTLKKNNPEWEKMKPHEPARIPTGKEYHHTKDWTIQGKIQRDKPCDTPLARPKAVERITPDERLPTFKIHDRYEGWEFNE
jgi:hypothetical protein